MKAKLKSSIFLISIFIFHSLFWQEGAGINYLLLTLFVSGSLIYLEKPVLSRLPLLFSFVCLVAVSVAIGWHGSLFAVVMYWIAFATFVGLVHSNTYNSNLSGFHEFFFNLMMFAGELKANMNSLGIVKMQVPRFLLKYMRLSFIPLLIVIVFFFLYKSANSVFDSLSMHFSNDVFMWFSNLFNGFSFPSFLFYIVSFWIMGATLFYGMQHRLSTEPGDRLKRKRTKRMMPIETLSPALRNENLTAIITFLSLNVLTGVVNLIDLKWIWVDYSAVSAPELSQFVHEGTYLLILSILLASGIVMYFFRANLNFYKKNKFLKVLAYVWIAQNLFMALSVAMRNYHYIHEYGLAYKRLGVIFFLIIVLVSLLSVVIKIRLRKTFWFYIKLNAWSAFAVLLVASFINWDIIIAKYNIHYAANQYIDAAFLLTLSPKTYPYISENKEKIISSCNDYYGVHFEDILNDKIDVYKAGHSQKSWLSWSHETEKALAQLQGD